MKSIFLIQLFLFISNQALASFTNASKDCPPSFSPNAENLGVSVDTLDDDFVTLGYFASGEFVRLSVQGCRTLSFSSPHILCNGRLIGSATSPLTVPSYGPPQARMTLSDSVSVTLVGSCTPADRSPLTLEFR